MRDLSAVQRSWAQKKTCSLKGNYTISEGSPFSELKSPPDHGGTQELSLDLEVLVSTTVYVTPTH